MNEEELIYGLLESPLNPKDWRMGGVTGSQKTVLREDGQYLDFLPKEEMQIGVYFDTMSCVSFSALNNLEILHRLRGETVNYSDRFLSTISGTTQKGNSFVDVAEALRLNGAVNEDRWPYPRLQRDPVYTWEEFSSPIPEDLKDEGKAWLDRWNLTWEWVATADLKEALKYGPLQVGIYAGNLPVNGIYSNPLKKRRNHAVTLIGYKEGEYWLIFDHYQNFIKKMDWAYDFGSCVQFSLTPKLPISDMPLNLPNDVLVQEVEQSGTFGLHLNGKIILGDEGKLLATWLLRNKGNVVGKAIPMTRADWEKFPKFDLKNNPLT